MEPSMHANNTVEQGKTIAIISYLTIIGLIIAYIMNNDKKNPFAAFHIRQSLGLILTGIVLSLGISLINMVIYLPFVLTAVQIALFVLWIIGLIAAVQGEEKTVPVLGKEYQKWLSGI